MDLDDPTQKAGGTVPARVHFDRGRHSMRRQQLRKLTAGAGLVAMLLGALMVLAPGGAGAEDVLQPVDKVTLCHRTNSVTNPYRIIEVAVDGSDGSLGNGKNDHTQHTGDPFTAPDDYVPPFNGDDWGDIIPPYQWGPNPADFFPGYNWDEAWDVADLAQYCGGEPEDPTTLTITKVVDGDAAPEEWSFSFSGLDDLGELTKGAPSSEALLIDAGVDYVITELDAQGASTDVSCTGTDSFSSDGLELTVQAEEPGDDIECTFTNTFRSHVVVVKSVTGANAPQTWEFDFTLCAGEVATFQAANDAVQQEPVCEFTLGNGAEQVSSRTFYGDYFEITEIDDDNLDGIECLNSQQEPVGVAEGSTMSVGFSGRVVCTFTNDFPGTPPPPEIPPPTPASLTVIKDVTGDVPDEWEFAFEYEGPETEFFTLDESDDDETFSVPAGEYELTEFDDAGDLATLVDVECLDAAGADVTDVIDTGVVALDLAQGADVTCTYTNDFAEVEDEEETPTPTILEPEVDEQEVLATTTTTTQAEAVLGAQVTRLPRTGNETRDLAGLGAALIGLGAALVVSSRRREAMSS